MFVPLAYDCGGVTTSTVTVSLVAALGIGLATNVPGRFAINRWFWTHSFCFPFPYDYSIGLC